MLKTKRILELEDWLEKKFGRKFSKLELLHLRGAEGLTTKIRYEGDVVDVKGGTLCIWDDPDTEEEFPAMDITLPSGLAFIVLEEDFEILEQ